MIFSLQTFYYNILFLFDDPDDDWAKETLAHLQKYFFPGNSKRRGGKKQPTIPIPSEETDMMRVQRERAERARQRRREQESGGAGGSGQQG
ncbi:hypothetical protein H0H92_014115 [Tricholoma furcatifolium]|nr:hypothetical protein H0H92_014115 [Tricholoma furcatifolium]